MVVVFHQLPGRVYATKGGVPWVDTNLKTFGLLPASKITKTQTIDFPSLHQDSYWYWSGIGIGGTPPKDEETLGGLVTLLPQNWGPQAAYPGRYTDNLADILLGTVPTGTDFINVKAKITRTLAPNAAGNGLMADTLPPVPPMGKAIKLLGGSCLLEESYPLARGFAIILVGTSVYLRRYQSVGADLTPIGPPGDWEASNNPATNGYATCTSTRGNIAQMLVWGSNLVHNTPFLYQRGQSYANGILAGVTTDFHSTYSAVLEITPGFFKTDATLNAPVNPAIIRLGALASASTVSSVSATLPFGVAQSTRHILVECMSSAPVSSVSIGGVAATLLVQDPGVPSVIGAGTSSIWLAAVPTGISGNVTVNSSGSTGIIANVYALYNFASWSPRDTKSFAHNGTSGGGTTQTIGTAATGWMFACSMHLPFSISASSIAGIMSGLDSQGRQVAFNSVSASSVGMIAEAGLDITNGASRTVTLADISGQESLAMVSLA